MMLLYNTGEGIALAATDSETGSIGDDRENLEEQSCHGLQFYSRAEWCLCAAESSWLSGKT